MKPSFSSALISGMALTTCFSLGQQTGMLLPLQHRGSWTVPQTFPGLALVSFSPFIPRVASGRICKPTHGMLLSGIMDLCQLCHPCSLSGALDGPQEITQPVMTREGWTTQVIPIDPEKIGHSLVV